MEPLGNTQQNVFEYIKLHILRRGYSPSLHDISGNLGIGVSTVQYHLSELERKEYLTRERYQARSISLTEKKIGKTPEEITDWFFTTFPKAEGLFTRDELTEALRKIQLTDQAA